ncbi:MAG: LPS export ABC transporter periplasmic protein LptC [Treponema sp.]|jgi:LPS export ABC transporter protein LptC|nr:LPS export ABC transporter periplasmic protein LptC [Treponema sp.]
MGQSLLISVILVISTVPFWACTFDYGSSTSERDDQPDIVMKDVEYVRVRDGDPIVRFTAETAERYDKRQTMELKNFTFEQFEHRGAEVNAVGTVGTASVQLDSGNIRMEEGVVLEVESENITIETQQLDWQDKERLLSGREENQVDISRSDGTNFSGHGFSANARSRTWGFSAGIEGTYIHEDEEEETPAEEPESAP